MSVFEPGNDNVKFERVGPDHRAGDIETIVRHRPGNQPPQVQFVGTCHCGARSRPLTAAGQAHGWHEGHLMDVLKEMASGK